MNDGRSFMRREGDEAGAVIERFLAREAPRLDAIARRWRDAPPRVVTTAARGSSDHAASVFKYVCEISTGVPVASLGPSLASLYDAPLALPGGLHLSVSQSGASPDIVALQGAARRGGAMTVAFVNVEDSPLARGADLVVPLHAGRETSVAATKSFLVQCTALMALVARVAGDDALMAALHALPNTLAAVAETPAEALGEELVGARSLYLAARGPASGIAAEAALKAKETAGLHAEAFSLAELMHGPLQLVEPGFPVVAFLPPDASLAGGRKNVERLRALGASVTTLGCAGSGCDVELPSTGHPFADAPVFALAWYRIIEAVTLRRGLDPDRPTRLSKVTETV